MCFELKKGQRVKTAKEDIKCYKVLKRSDGICISPYRNEEYTTIKGTIKTIPKFVKQYYFTPGFNPDICEGLHSHIDLYNANGMCKTKNIHSDKFPYEVHLFIIPKGTKYYENNYGYVSLALKYVTKVNL